jgi:hypothetical protein
LRPIRNHRSRAGPLVREILPPILWGHGTPASSTATWQAGLDPLPIEIQLNLVFMILPSMILPSHSRANRRPNDPGTSRKIIDGKIIRRTVKAGFATTGPGLASSQGASCRCPPEFARALWDGGSKARSLSAPPFPDILSDYCSSAALRYRAVISVIPVIDPETVVARELPSGLSPFRFPSVGSPLRVARPGR